LAAQCVPSPTEIQIKTKHLIASVCTVAEQRRVYRRSDPSHLGALLKPMEYPISDHRLSDQNVQSLNHRLIQQKVVAASC